MRQGILTGPIPCCCGAGVSSTILTRELSDESACRRAAENPGAFSKCTAVSFNLLDATSTIVEEVVAAFDHCPAVRQIQLMMDTFRKAGRKRIGNDNCATPSHRAADLVDQRRTAKHPVVEKLLQIWPILDR